MARAEVARAVIGVVEIPGFCGIDRPATAGTGRATTGYYFGEASSRGPVCVSVAPRRCGWAFEVEAVRIRHHRPRFSGSSRHFAFRGERRLPGSREPAAPKKALGIPGTGAVGTASLGYVGSVLSPLRALSRPS